MRDFVRLGIPTRDTEAWKYLRVAPVFSDPFQVSVPLLHRLERVELEAIVPSELLDDPHLVFVNGRFSPDLSRSKGLPAGVSIRSFSECLARDPECLKSHWGLLSAPRAARLGRRQELIGENPFAALNTALAEEGLVIRAERGVVSEKPLRLLYISTPDAENAHLAARHLLVLEPEAQFSLFEGYWEQGESRHFTNAVTEVVASSGAKLAYAKLQGEGRRALHFSQLAIQQGESSEVAAYHFPFGSQLGREEIAVRLSGKNAHVALHGLYLGAGHQVLDAHSRIDHEGAETASRTLYRGVVGGAARGVWNSKVVVHPGAEGADSLQKNHNLLLSREAEVDPKPELEIYADAVKASHGATVGALDANALFYLASRGFPPDLARHLLTVAFAEERVGVLPDPALRTVLARVVREKVEALMKDASDV